MHNAPGNNAGGNRKRRDSGTAPPEGNESVLQGGPVSNPLALRHERLSGTISKYVPSNGYGLVRSHLFEGELQFKTESIMLECQNYEFQEREGVEFDVQSDERGRPHAVALKPVVGRKPSECLGQRHRGYVRRFADRWGFVNAAAFDGDLFVHRDNLLLSVPDQLQDSQPPLRAGQAVEFDVALDDRGRTVAKQITTSALLRPCDWIGRRLHGYIRSFQGAWGFINSDRFAGDLFVHRDSLLAQYQGVELTVGTMVEFDVERDHHKKGGKNRLVARQVAILHQPNAQPPAPYYQAAPPQAPQPTTGVLPPPEPQLGMMQPQQFMQPPPQYSQQMMPQPPQPQMPQVQYGQPPPYAYAQPLSTGAPPQGHVSAYAYQAVPPQPAVPMPAPDGTAQMLQPQAQSAVVVEGAAPAPAEGQQPQVLLHITTHDWEPDQSGQLRVRKGTLVNVSHRAAHGWVYAATVQHGNEPMSEGWVPQAVAKRVSLCRVVIDWPAEGSGTLGLNRGDLIAVSKEAERGWVYGERISPRRPDWPSDGWLPKKVLEYILL